MFVASYPNISVWRTPPAVAPRRPRLPPPFTRGAATGDDGCIFSNNAKMVMDQLHASREAFELHRMNRVRDRLYERHMDPVVYELPDDVLRGVSGIDMYLSACKPTLSPACAHVIRGMALETLTRATRNPMINADCISKLSVLVVSLLREKGCEP